MAWLDLEEGVRELFLDNQSYVIEKLHNYGVNRILRRIESDRKYRELHKKEIKERHKLWVANNVEEYRASMRRYYHRNKEAIKAKRADPEKKAERSAYLKKYYASHKESFLARARAWKRRNAEKQKAYNKAYKARKKAELCTVVSMESIQSPAGSVTLLTTNKS